VDEKKRSREKSSQIHAAMRVGPTARNGLWVQTMEMSTLAVLNGRRALSAAFANSQQILNSLQDLPKNKWKLKP
jgi:hypothetical protein